MSCQTTYAATQLLQISGYELPMQQGQVMDIIHISERRLLGDQMIVTLFQEVMNTKSHNSTKQVNVPRNQAKSGRNTSGNRDTRENVFNNTPQLLTDQIVF